MVVGGGAGGCGTANKFATKFGAGEVAVIDPASEHFYQPMWTLVGGGVKDLAQTRRPMESLLPGSARWLKDSVSRFEPDKNCLHTAAGDIITYDWLVVATGLVLRSVSRSDKSLLVNLLSYCQIREDQGTSRGLRHSRSGVKLQCEVRREDSQGDTGIPGMWPGG